jgi:iron(II)-dependent oxidoreductase
MLKHAPLALLLVSALHAAEPGMVFIPGGDYLRGRSHTLPDDHLKWFPALLQDDRPVRRIHVDPFYLDTHEVSNEQYAAFLKATRRRPPPHWVRGEMPAGKERHPVANVSWEDASEYARWMGKRLPTEAEWERACRGLAEGSKYFWGERPPGKEDARYGAVDGPVATGQCRPNYFGLYDIAGNVWEWCADWYELGYYQKAPERNPRGPATGMYRVLRGGSWLDEPKFLTCAYRSWARPAEKSPNIGFRCAKSFGERR